jgi:hypothetical protein
MFSDEKEKVFWCWLLISHHLYVGVILLHKISFILRKINFHEPILFV